MLEEPYRWVEAIRNRREYLDDQLRGASPVVGTCYQNGVLLLTTTPGPRKVFEVYNQIAFAAIGHPADMEKLRKALIDIAHLEGFNLSAADVNLQRLVSFGIAPLIKAAFDEIFRSPYLARVLVAELDPLGSEDVFYTIDADGSFVRSGRTAAVSGSDESAEAIVEQLATGGGDVPLDEALDQALKAWAYGRLLLDSAEKERPDAAQVEAFLRDALQDLQVEAAVLDRSLPTQSKFYLLGADELQGTLDLYAKA